MALYREGKAAMAADGTVTGTGTKWQSSLSLIRPGATIMFLSSPIQMAVVNKVVSDTEIKAITTKGAVVASSDYAILLSDSLTVDGLAQDVAETLRYYQSQETVIAEAVEFFKDFDFEALQNLANQIKADSEAAESSAAAAAASENAAKTSETNSKASEVAAETARDQVQQIINDAGEQSTLVALAQPDGGGKVNIGNATLIQLAEGNIFSKMTKADINTMLNTPGAEVAVDYALQAIIDAGYKSVRFPHTVKGIYTLNGSVILPGGFTIYGECSKPYTVSGDSSFVGKGTVIRKALGADYIFGPGSIFRIYGCIFDGRDKARPFINNKNQLRGGILYNCGLYRFLYGVGSYGYTSIQVGRSSICANAIGIRNLIDSKIIDVVINTQSSHGVDLQEGANNNIFVNVRNEWNDGVGYNIYGSVGNIITGELVDRNGSANFAIRNGGGAIIGNLFSQRPARLSAEGVLYNTHFYIEGSGSYLMLSNVKTTKGVDDGGTGTLTPERVITTGGTATDMTVQATGCDLTGYTVSALRESITIDNKLFRNNLGVSDTVTNGLYQMTTGRQNIGGAKTNQVLSSGAGSTLTLTFSHPALADPTSNPIPRPKRRKILIEAMTSSGVYSTYDVEILIRRISATAAVSTLQGKEFSSPAGLWGVTGATGVTVAVSVNADASTVTVQLTNVDGVGRFVDVTLLP